MGRLAVQEEDSLNGERKRVLKKVERRTSRVLLARRETESEQCRVTSSSGLEECAESRA